MPEEELPEEDPTEPTQDEVGSAREGRPTPVPTEVPTVTSTPPAAQVPPATERPASGDGGGEGSFCWICLLLVVLAILLAGYIVHRWRARRRRRDSDAHHPDGSDPHQEAG